MIRSFKVQIIFESENEGPLITKDLPDTYETIGAAMKAAKRAAGPGAVPWHDYISVRYAGPNGTAYVMKNN